MTETAPEPTTQGPPKTGGGKLGIWAKKAGPLPVWGWAGIGLIVVLIYMYWKNKNSGSSASNAGAGTAADSAAAGTGAGQIPEFVNQTYTTVTPPSEPTSPTPTPQPGNQIPGHHVITSNGNQTLAQIAAANGTTSADIVAFTKAHKPHISATEAKFFSKPSGKVPKGILLWVPEPQVTNITGPGGGKG